MGLHNCVSIWRTLTDLRVVNELVEWDQQTMMPPRGVEARAASLATLGRIRHDMFISDATSGGCSRPPRATSTGSLRRSDEASLVRVTTRRWEKARRVPGELTAERAHAGSLGQKAWVHARANSDFAVVRALPGAQPRARAPLRRLL